LGLYPSFFHTMLEQEIALPPSAYEVFFPSLAHTDKLIERTVEAFAIAATTVA
jgi:glutamate-1-semialdehyde 2,1-aminomutase